MLSWRTGVSQESSPGCRSPRGRGARSVRSQFYVQDLWLFKMLAENFRNTRNAACVKQNTYVAGFNTPSPRCPPISALRKLLVWRPPAAEVQPSSVLSAPVLTKLGPRWGAGLVCKSGSLCRLRKPACRLFLPRQGSPPWGWRSSGWQSLPRAGFSSTVSTSAASACRTCGPSCPSSLKIQSCSRELSGEGWARGQPRARTGCQGWAARQVPLTELSLKIEGDPDKHKASWGPVPSKPEQGVVFVSDFSSLFSTCAVAARRLPVWGGLVSCFHRLWTAEAGISKGSFPRHTLYAGAGGGGSEKWPGRPLREHAEEALPGSSPPKAAQGPHFSHRELLLDRRACWLCRATKAW